MYSLSAEEAESLRRLTAALTFGRSLRELTAEMARSLAALIEFDALAARLPGEKSIRVGPDGGILEADPPGSATRVHVGKALPDGKEVSLTLRRRRVEPFSERDVMLVELAAPSFAWAVTGRTVEPEAVPGPAAHDEAGLLPATGTLLFDGEGIVIGTDGAGARLARASLPASPGTPVPAPGADRNAAVPGALTAAVRDLMDTRVASWTKEVTLSMRQGGYVRVRLARVGGRNVSIVAFLSVVAGTAAGVESEAILAGLTRREREVAERAARGASNGEIAHELKISAETVKQHLTAIFKKAGVDGRAGLAGRLFFAKEGGKA